MSPLYAIVRLLWRALWLWSPMIALLPVNRGAAALALLATYCTSSVIDRRRGEPLGESVKAALGLTGGKS